MDIYVAFVFQLNKKNQNIWFFYLIKTNSLTSINIIKLN